MLDKLKFNNLVISNKKDIQRGRVQTVNKVVQKLRKIKQLLEKQPGDAKLKEREQKCLRYIEGLKKLKRLEIIKMTLLLDKKPTSILTNNRSTPDEVVIALLAQNKIIVNLIEKFKKDLALVDSDQEWRDQLMQSSKRSMKINKTEEKRQKRKDLKLQKATARQRLEWLEKNKPDKTEDNELSSSNLCGPLEPESGPNKENGTIKAERKELVHSKNSLQKNHQKSKVVKAVEKQKVVAPSTTERKKPEPIEPKVTHVEDPFFITDQGKSYLSTAVVTETDTSAQVGQEDRRVNSFKSKRDFKRKGDEVRVDVEPQDESLKNLHPSWAAKLKQKVAILPSKVKKIYFDEENNPKEIIHSENKKSVNKTQTDTEADKLHPSWVAKQKMKPNITLFQGKKIKFSDDDS